MFEKKSQTRLFAISMVAALTVLANAAMALALTDSRYPISELSIAKELGVVGVSVDTSEIHLSASISARNVSPKLEIVRVQPLGVGQVRIELRCSSVEECLPFFATVDVKDANLVTAKIQSKTASTTAADLHAAARISGESASRAQLRVGSHALLIMRDGHLNIHLQVLAIDTGTIGQQVRVCTLDRRKVFRATVIGEGTVAGEIE